MGHNSTVQTIATFTGTLLRRERAVGQKCVQLVFREGEENWLCVSADMKHNTLVVGKKYRVEGVFKKYGERPYIHTPIIAPYKSRFRKLAPYMAMGLVAVCAVGVVVYSYAGRHGNASHVLGTSITPSPAAYVTQTAGSAVAPTVPQVQAEATPAVTPTTDSTKKATKPPQTNTTTPVTNNSSATQSTSTDTSSTDTSTQPTDNTGGGATGGTGADGATNPADGGTGGGDTSGSNQGSDTPKVSPLVDPPATTQSAPPSNE